jgi:hypothetical protein
MFDSCGGNWELEGWGRGPSNARNESRPTTTGVDDQRSNGGIRFLKRIEESIELAQRASAIAASLVDRGEMTKRKSIADAPYRKCSGGWVSGATSW